ncbi:hypothetical protein ACEWY4_008926 [Coilia grayii]|uniref:Multidrug and toxin extrusion protein n=1 Tax=Coilia grayii TaxID=363190 RepID=A0ABD1K503_9TELE
MAKVGVPEAAGGQAGAGQLTEETAASGKFGWLRRLLPLAYREELYHVIRLTGPLVISRVLNFLQPLVITIVCGRLGNTELAGYALASALISVTTTATGFGLTLACDTLISQTFGSGNLKRVGEILQRSTLILLLFCLPCWAILINAESLLLAMGQEPAVASITQLYALAFLPAVPAMFLHQLQMSYLQNQGIILPQMYTAAVANVINIGMNYMLISKMELGVNGSAIANSLYQIILCLLLFGYIHWKQLHVKTWGGWSSACLQEWGSFMKLAVPSALLLCFDWWIYEIGSFFAGIFSEEELSAQHIVMDLCTIFYMIQGGIHAAVSVRVGNALGAGDEARAQITCKVGLVLCSALAVCQGVVIASTRSFIGYIFTNDATIVGTISRVMTLFIILEFFDALVCLSIGILVGAGKQRIVAVVNLICYYCIGLPVAYALMFTACLGILGWWLGLFVCLMVQTCSFVTVIFRLDWRKAAEEAQKRAGKVSKVTCVGQKPPAGLSVVDSLVPEIPESPEKSPDVGATAATGGVCQRDNAYAAVSTDDEGWLESGRDGGKDGGRDGGMDGGKESSYAAVCTEDQDQLESGRDGGKEPTPAPAPPARLSVSQLVLRRGLTLLVAILALVVGVVMHFQYPPQPAHSQWANGTSTLYNCTAPF